jgi:hypothetical protein
MLREQPKTLHGFQTNIKICQSEYQRNQLKPAAVNKNTQEIGKKYTELWSRWWFQLVLNG